jgi:2-keto-4-pentenoate hydratase/2-oxohepta-3-ene-1,7-dioic acid hydratase in catechol pathway
MKIFCTGMNYAQHNKQLNFTFLEHDAPVVFLKPDSALMHDNKPFFVPDDMGRIDFEVELVVRICKLGKTVPVRFAPRYYDAVTLGIDFTARDLKDRLASRGLPWDVSKGFDGAACIGQWVPKDHFLNLKALPFRLDRNGETVQEGCTADMLTSVDELIAYISQYDTLKTGDLLFTGTPSSSLPVSVGDRLEGWIGESRVLDVKCK